MARRPPRFDDRFIGQRAAIRPVTQALEGAIARNESLPDILLIGQSGVGKTLFTDCLAKHCRAVLKKVFGTVTHEELCTILTSLHHGDFLFIDECHCLTPDVQELLFQVIDSREISVGMKNGGKTGKEKKETTKLAAFTLVLATNRPGMLLPALRKRMSMRVLFVPYSVREMKEIVEVIAKRTNLLLSPQAANRLARVCNGLPRQALHLLGGLRLYLPNSESRKLGLSDVKRFLASRGIDRYGLGHEEHLYMRHLHRMKRASLATLAGSLGIDTEYVEYQIEPQLLHRGFLRKGSYGRELTESGQQWIEKLGQRSKKRLETKNHGDD